MRERKKLADRLETVKRSGKGYGGKGYGLEGAAEEFVSKLSRAQRRAFGRDLLESPGRSDASYAFARALGLDKEARVFGGYLYLDPEQF